jgi:phosphomethylpyrimidine kinase
MHTALTVAGSDPSGGAGIQADLKTMCAFGVFGMSAVTALTIQNTRSVSGVHEVPADMVRGQIEAVFDDIPPDAVKVGMVANAGIAAAIREALEKRDVPRLVIDPVMVSKSGCRLIHDDAVKETVRLMRTAVLVTPNLPEASLLADMDITTKDDMREAARKIQILGVQGVLVKGGALRGDADDFLLIGNDELWLTCPRIATRNTHGTGCTLSAAIVCGLAQGLSVTEATIQAKRYVTEAIKNGVDIGHGVGPLGHMAALAKRAGLPNGGCP